MNKRFFTSTICASVLIFTGLAQAGSGHHGKGRFMSFFDTNGDDVVTMEEFKSAAAERFTKMDEDTNGSVTREEFRNYISEKREMWSERRFSKMDANEDGNVSEAEYLEYRQKKAQRRFQRMDTDADGVLSSEEYKNRRSGKKYGKHGKGRIFSKLDKNGDGVITKDESLSAWTEWFARIDSNNDSVVTAEEVRNYRMKKLDRKD